MRHCRLLAVLLALGAAAGLYGASGEAVNMFGEGEKVAMAFGELSAALRLVEGLDISYTSVVHSIQGDILSSGSICQEMPYRFRSDVRTHAMDGITRAHELIVSDGTNGWEVSYSPNGKVVSCSYWTLVSMGEIFNSFLLKATPCLLTVARTNTYESLRYDYLFEDVRKSPAGYEFSGHIRHDSELLKSVAKQATAMGASGFSNFVPNKVVMKVSNDGIVTEFSRFNLFGRPLTQMRLTSCKVNSHIDPALYRFTPPAGLFLTNLDVLQEMPSMYVRHDLLHKKAPDIRVNYLSGKDKIIKPGTRGVTVLTFFATWSQLCREYMAVIDKLHGKYAGTGVQFVNVSDQSDMKTLEAYQRGLGTVIYSDPERRCIKAYSVDNIPKTFVIDKEGVVRYVMEGFNTASELELGKRVEELRGKGEETGEAGR